MPARAQAPAAQTQPSGGESTFTVFLQGVPIGSERSTVTTGPSSRTITGSGGLGNPLNIQTERLEIRYDGDWKPLELILDASVRGQRSTIHTTFAGTTATNVMTQGDQTTSKTDPVAADTIVLPNPFFAAYEALTARLALVQPGAELRAYLAPQIEIGIRYTSATEERIQTPGRTILAKRYNLTFANPTGPLLIEVWGDDNGRLLRVRVPTQQLEVVRQDVLSVASRVETAFRAGDQQIRIPANGFTLAATMSAPPASASAGTATANTRAPRLPAVVLVPPSGPEDRDVVIVGIPIFAQIASALADAGWFVVRYDKRGVGQSGGRSEAVVVDDYADDARAVIRYLRKQKTIDPKRVAVVGYGDGGWIALAAAAKEKDLAALALLATASSPGASLLLEQQQRALERLNMTAGDKQAKIALQERIHRATLTGNGWADLPVAVRRQADTPWFKSFLSFDPGVVFARVRQPVLVLGGQLDREVLPSQGDRFATLTTTRKGAPSFERISVPDVNHLLVPATSGEIDEYGALKERTVSAKLLVALISWLQRTMK